MKRWLEGWIETSWVLTWAIALVFGCSLIAQDPAPITPMQIIDTRSAAGIPCINCSLYTYAAGTTTPLVTYTDHTLGTANNNPVLTNSQGYAVNGSTITGVWIGTSCYKFVLKDASAATIWTQDFICDQARIFTALIEGSTGAANVGFTPTGGNATTVGTFLNSAGAIYPQFFTGSDMGAQIAAACTYLGTSSGIINATGYSGNQVISNGEDIFSCAGTGKVLLLLGNVNISCTGVAGVTHTQACIVPRSNVTIWGNGRYSTVITQNNIPTSGATGSNRIIETYPDSSNIEIAHLQINGNKSAAADCTGASYSGQNFAIISDATTNIHLWDLYIYNSCADGIINESGLNSGDYTSGEENSNIILNSLRADISYISATDLDIHDNYLTQPTGGGFDCLHGEADSPTQSNLRLKINHNTTINCGITIAGRGAADQLTLFGFSQITANNIFDGYIADSQNPFIVIANNNITVAASGYPGTSQTILCETHDCSITGNLISYTSTVSVGNQNAGIYLNCGTAFVYPIGRGHSNVTGNIIRNAPETGITNIDCPDTTISGNTIAGVQPDSGFSLGVDINEDVTVSPYIYSTSNSQGVTTSGTALTGCGFANATLFSIASGGTGYALNDTVTVVQAGGSGGEFTVTGVTGGVITSISPAILNSTGPVCSTGYTTATGVSTTGGTGSGATVNINTGGWVGALIEIGGTLYRITACASSSACTLNTSAGSNSDINMVFGGIYNVNVSGNTISTSTENPSMTAYFGEGGVIGHNAYTGNIWSGTISGINSALWILSSNAVLPSQVQAVIPTTFATRPCRAGVVGGYCGQGSLIFLSDGESVADGAMLGAGIAGGGTGTWATFESHTQVDWRTGQ